MQKSKNTLGDDDADSSQKRFNTAYYVPPAGPVPPMVASGQSSQPSAVASAAVGTAVGPAPVSSYEERPYVDPQFAYAYEHPDMLPQHAPFYKPGQYYYPQPPDFQFQDQWDDSQINLHRQPIPAIPGVPALVPSHLSHPNPPTATGTTGAAVPNSSGPGPHLEYMSLPIRPQPYPQAEASAPRRPSSSTKRSTSGSAVPTSHVSTSGGRSSRRASEVSPTISQTGPESSSNTPSPCEQKPVAKRSRMGCLTCRQRKKRCCETRPKCNECTRLRLNCVWPAPGTEHKNKPKDAKEEENTINHEIYGKIKVLRGIVEYRSS